MVISDIMTKKPEDNRTYSVTFSAETVVETISDRAALDSDLIGIIDEEGQVIGEVTGEILHFILNGIKILHEQAIMNAFDEGIVCISPKGRIFYVNDAYSSIIGVSKNRIIGRYIQEIEPGAEIIRVIETRKPIINPRVHIKSVDKNVSVKIYPLYRGTEFVGAYSVFKDITEVTQLNKEVKRISDVALSYNKEIEAVQSGKELNIIGESPLFIRAIDRARIVGRTDATVMITGENGAGKEKFAKLIHSCSERRDKQFITVNCAAIPENLIESELFGYEKGSFTGADPKGKIGKFEMADHGTIFLDEIGDMPMHMQAKLLRVLENGEIEKIGRAANIPVDVRVIAATNQPVEDLVEAGRFRKDLYYRLNVIHIEVPPLRRRGHDAMILANHFIHIYGEKYNKQLTLSEEAGRYIEKYNWPGNVRELQNFIEAKVIMAEGDKIELDAEYQRENSSSAKKMKAMADDNSEKTFHEQVREFEHWLIEETLENCGGNREKAIKKLGMNKRTFYRKLAKMQDNEGDNNDT